MEARVAHLESDVENISVNVAEIKVELRALRDKVDGVGSQLFTSFAQLNGKIDTSIGRLDAKADGSFAHLDAKIDGSFAHLDAKIDSSVARLDAKIDSSSARLDAKVESSVGELRGYCVSQFNAIDGKFERVLDSIATAKVWALTLYIALAVAMFGTMARAFDWL